MDLYLVGILISSLSFFAYSYYYFVSPGIKSDLERLGVGRLGLFITVSQFFGACGLLIGLWFNSILIASSFGLSLLMFCGLIVRVKSKDNLWVSLPALFYLILNTCVCVKALAQ
jgi:hypothetical protein